MTKIIDVLNVRKRGGKSYSKTGFSRTDAELLKLFETKGKIKKEEVGTHYFIVFDGLIKDGYIKPADESEFYELSEDGKGVIRFYKKRHRTLYENINL